MLASPATLRESMPPLESTRTQGERWGSGPLTDTACGWGAGQPGGRALSGAEHPRALERFGNVIGYSMCRNEPSSATCV